MQGLLRFRCSRQGPGGTGRNRASKSGAWAAGECRKLYKPGRIAGRLSDLRQMGWQTRQSSAGCGGHCRICDTWGGKPYNGSHLEGGLSSFTPLPHPPGRRAGSPPTRGRALTRRSHWPPSPAPKLEKSRNADHCGETRLRQHPCGTSLSHRLLLGRESSP
jgi:hypothetical protein